MGNFYKDNKDIENVIDALDLSEVATLLEEDFKFASEYDFAPKNAEDAIDNYKRALDVCGDICGNRIAATAEETDKVGNVLDLNTFLNDVRNYNNANGKTADRVAGEVKFADLFHVAYAQVGVGAALVDAEEELTGVDGFFELGETVEFFLAAAEPSCGAVAGIAGVVVFGGVFDAFVKRHGDGGAEVGLDSHAFFRSHENALAVDVGGELHALLGDLAEGGQGEDLESAAVGQNRLGPVHELVQAPHVVDELVAGADVEVVGVGQLYLTVNVIQELHGGYTALDGGAGAHVHENGGLDVTVNGVEHASAGASVGCENRKHRFLFLGLSQCNVRPVVIYLQIWGSAPYPA